MNSIQVKQIFLIASLMMLSQSLFSVIIDEKLSVFYLIILYCFLLILLQYLFIFLFIPSIPIKQRYIDFIIKFFASCSLSIMAVSFILSTSVSYLILHINYKLIYISITISIFVCFVFFIKNKFTFYVFDKTCISLSKCIFIKKHFS